ncbi:hypothetical protein DPMN_150904 [Dreissena polymorpha]|uniref:Uncharacterized protein n=1 Tax=Dreissena polymorpha TaxID=45954 RepID=A0A9D4FIV5_DREPO|nr:hypothetical protein DPMN_150904 [Dreissena polymorpha]
MYLTSLYPEDRIWGVYAARERLCADRTTRCCALCRILLEGEVSEPEGRGMTLRSLYKDID